MKPSGSSRRSKPNDSRTRRKLALQFTRERDTDDRTAGRRTEHDKEKNKQTEHHEILKPTWAQHRPGRGLHAAERVGEAKKPGPKYEEVEKTMAVSESDLTRGRQKGKRPGPTFKREGIDKIPFNTQECNEENMRCTKLKDGRYRWTSEATAGHGTKRLYGVNRLRKQEALAVWVTTHESTLDPAEVKRLRATFGLVVAQQKKTKQVQNLIGTNG